MIDKLRTWYNELRPNSKEANMVLEMTDALEQAHELFVQGLAAASKNRQNAKSTTEEGGVRMMIREKNGFKYVEAERNILTGDDPLQWEKQLEDYINKSIRNGNDVVFPTDDGHFLVLTERSAYKLTDRHKSAIADKIEEFLSNEEYYRKGMAAAHIDELIQVAKFNNHKEDVNNKHENDIGEDGFNYYTAFFKDSDGKYYRVRFSSALNGDAETVYSFGDIRKRRFPNRAGSSPNGALKNGRKSSNPIIYTSEDESQDIKAPYQKILEKYLNNFNQSKEPNTENNPVMKQSRDADYLSAVERGDMDTAQKMVDEAAKAAGYTIKAYHGTGEDFNVFDLKKSGTRTRELVGDAALGMFFFASIKESYPGSAQDYARHAGQKTGTEHIKEVYLRINNPLVVDSKGWYSTAAYYDNNYDEIYDKYFFNEKYDGIIVKDSSGGDDNTIYLTDNSKSIKSADPVTYDDNGEVIPLSERFNDEQKDIRYSERFTDLDDDEFWLSEEATDTELLAHHLEESPDAIGKTEVFHVKHGIIQRRRESCGVCYLLIG